MSCLLLLNLVSFVHICKIKRIEVVSDRRLRLIDGTDAVKIGQMFLKRRLYLINQISLTNVRLSILFICRNKDGLWSNFLMIYFSST